MVSIGLLADFNVQNLAALLQRNSSDNQVTCVQAPFNQTMSILLNSEAEFWSLAYDAVVLWTFPDIAVPSFSKVLSFEEYSLEDLLQEVNSFAGLVERIPERVRTIFIPSWSVPRMDRGWGPLDLINGVGVANALMRINLALADLLGWNRRVVLLDSWRWLCAAGAGAYSPRLDRKSVV